MIFIIISLSFYTTVFQDKAPNIYNFFLKKDNELELVLSSLELAFDII